MTTLTQKIDARVEMARTVTLRGIRWTEAKNSGARVWSTEVIDLDGRSIRAEVVKPPKGRGRGVDSGIEYTKGDPELEMALYLTQNEALREATNRLVEGWGALPRD